MTCLGEGEPDSQHMLDGCSWPGLLTKHLAGACRSPFLPETSWGEESEDSSENQVPSTAHPRRWQGARFPSQEIARLAWHAWLLERACQGPESCQGWSLFVLEKCMQSKINTALPGRALVPGLWSGWGTRPANRLRKQPTIESG